jgi:hypothetical protein
MTKTASFLRRQFLAFGSLLLLAGCRHPSISDPRTDPPLVRIAIVQNKASSLSRFVHGNGRGAGSKRPQLPRLRQGSGETRQLRTSRCGEDSRSCAWTTLISSCLNAQEEAVVAAAARARQATEDETRDRNLAADGAEPVSTYDRMRATAEAARAQLKAAEAQAKVARNATGYALLVADADGVIVETLAEPVRSSGGQTVVRLAQHGPREAVVPAAETLRPSLGSSAQATLYGRAGVASSDAPARAVERRRSADADLPGKVRLGGSVRGCGPWSNRHRRRA